MILWRLRLGSMRIRDFKKDIKGCNEKMLIDHLNELLKTGLITKIEHEDVYPKQMCIRDSCSLNSKNLFKSNINISE